VAVNHAGDGDRASDEDGDDRNQKRPQAYDGIEDSIHSPPPAPSGAKALFLFWALLRHDLSRALPGRAVPQFREAIDRPSQVSGGADRDRTGGLLVANQALSQLSYSPNPRGQGSGSSGQKILLTTIH
jgi:hypothetical protein